MREILYRGKRLDNDEWVEGDLVHNGFLILIYKLPEETKYMTVTYIIDPDTVGQYTGFKDKNGKKIFEGDIVVDGRGHYGKVFFENGCFLIEWTIKDYIKGKSVDDSFGCAEVVSNIYDHPELLEVK